MLCSTAAEISSAENSRFSPSNSTWISGLSFAPRTISTGPSFEPAGTTSSLKCLPIRRLASNTVFLGLRAACSIAASPTSLSLSVNATTEGVVLCPSELAMISTRSSRHTPTQEYVVPKSIPTATSVDDDEVAAIFLQKKKNLFFSKLVLGGKKKSFQEKNRKT